MHIRCGSAILSHVEMYGSVFWILDVYALDDWMLGSILRCKNQQFRATNIALGSVVGPLGDM